MSREASGRSHAGQGQRPQLAAVHSVIGDEVERLAQLEQLQPA